MKKVIILRKIQMTMKSFAPPSFNHFNLVRALRSSRSQIFFRVGVLKDFANFTGKHLS